MKKKLKNSICQKGRMFLACLGLLPLHVAHLNAQTPTAVWRPGFPQAKSVNIGLSKPDSVFIRFGADSTALQNAVIKVTFSNPNDLYDPANPAKNIGGMGAINLGTPVWSAPTLTFPAKNLALGDIIYYAIPHKAGEIVTAQNADVTISITSNGSPILNGDSTLNYLYNRAQMILLPPAVLPLNQTGITLNFGANDGINSPGSNTAQPYKFVVKNSGGTVDSVKISLKTLSTAVTFANWTANGKPVTPVSVINGLETTYIFTLKGSDLPGGNNFFDDGEEIQFGANVTKNFCGNVPVQITAYWGGTDSNPYVKSTVASGTGAFISNGAASTPVALRGDMTMEYDFIPDGSNHADAMFHMDNSLMVISTLIKITSAASDFQYTINCHNSPGMSQYIDTAPIKYKIGKNGTLKNVNNVETLEFTKDTLNYRRNPAYLNQPNRVRISVNETVASGDTLFILWGLHFPNDAFYNNPGKERQIYCAPYLYDELTFKDPCKVNSGSIVGADNGWLLTGVMEARNTAGTKNLINGTPVTNVKAAELVLNTFNNTTVAWSQQLLYNRTDVNNEYHNYYSIRIAVPKGIELQNIRLMHRATNKDILLPASLPVASGDSLVYMLDTKNFKDTYAYTLNQDKNYDLYWDYVPTCPSGTSNGSKTIDLSFNYHSMGVDPWNDVVFERATQLYPIVNLTCNTADFNFTFDWERKTLGWADTDDDGIPNTLTPAAPNAVNHSQMLQNDSAHITLKGNVLSAGLNRLYPVLFMENNNHFYQVLSNDIQFSADGGLTWEPNGSTFSVILSPPTNSGGVATPVPATGANHPYPNSYAWEVRRTDYGYFGNGDQIWIRIPVRVDSLLKTTNPSGGSMVSNMSTWFYAGVAGTVADPLNPGTARKGDVVAGYQTNVFAPFTRGSYGNFIFTGDYSTGTNTVASIFPVWPQYPSGTDLDRAFPKEYRHLATVDSIVVEVPKGFILADNMTPTLYRKGYAGPAGSVSATPETTGALSLNRKVYVFGSSYFNFTTWNGLNCPPSLGYGISLKPNIMSTNLLKDSVYNYTVTVYTDAQTHTLRKIATLERPNSNDPQVYSNNSGKLTFVSTNEVVLTPKESTSKPASANMDWQINLSNNTSSNSKEVWLYVEGPGIVENAVLDINGTIFTGIGADNRWIPIPAALIPNANLDCKLSYDYTGLGGCVDDSIIVHPIFMNSAPSGWQPGLLTDADFAANFRNSIYVYPPLKLKIQSQAASISGSITPLALSKRSPSNLSLGNYGRSTINVDTLITTEVIFDAIASSGPVDSVYAIVNIPKGFEYVDNTAYLEYWNGSLTINAPITGNLKDILEVLDGIDPHTLTLKLTETGISTVDYSGTIDGGRKSTLRFSLKPTCDVPLTAPKISARFYGQRPCNHSLVQDASTHYSDPLILHNPFTAFQAVVSLTSSADSLICEPGRNISKMTMTFRKTTKPDESIGITDSIRIEMPANLNITGNLNYNYSSVGVIPENTGTIDANEITNRVSGNIRYISWPLPIDYYDALVTQTVATTGVCTYEWELKTNGYPNLLPNSFIISGDVLTKTAAGPSCSQTINIIASSQVNVILATSYSTRLSQILINNTTINNLDPSASSFDIILPCGTKKANISGIPWSDCANIDGIENVTLERTYKPFNLTVTAEAGNTQTYTINVRPLMPAKIESFPTQQVACEGNDYQMTIIASGDSLNYQWYYENDTLVNNYNTLFIPNPSPEKEYGYYKVEVTGACASIDSGITRFWVASPLPSNLAIEEIPSTIYAGERYKVHIGYDYGYSDVTKYIWNFDNGTVNYLPKGDGIDHTTFLTFEEGSRSGTLSVTMTHPCGQRIATKELAILVRTGINGTQDQILSIYPNPVTDLLTITHEQSIINGVEVTDINGRIIHRSEPYTTSCQISTTAWTNGVYIVSVSTTENVTTYKVVKK